MKLKQKMTHDKHISYLFRELIVDMKKKIREITNNFHSKMYEWREGGPPMPPLIEDASESGGGNNNNKFYCTRAKSPI